MTVEQRLSNLENLATYLARKIDNNKYYTDADTQGNRIKVNSTDTNVEKNTADIDYIMMMEEL